MCLSYIFVIEYVAKVSRLFDPVHLLQSYTFEYLFINSKLRQNSSLSYLNIPHSYLIVNMH